MQSGQAGRPVVDPAELATCLRILDQLATNPDEPAPMRNGARAGPAKQPSGAPQKAGPSQQSGTAQKTGTKKSNRKH